MLEGRIKVTLGGVHSWKGHMGTSCGISNVLCLEFGSGDIGVYICKKSSSCTLKIGVLCVLYIC